MMPPYLSMSSRQAPTPVSPIMLSTPALPALLTLARSAEVSPAFSRRRRSPVNSPNQAEDSRFHLSCIYAGSLRGCKSWTKVGARLEAMILNLCPEQGAGIWLISDVCCVCQLPIVWEEARHGTPTEVWVEHAPNKGLCYYSLGGDERHGSSTSAGKFPTNDRASTHLITCTPWRWFYLGHVGTIYHRLPPT